MKDDEIKKEILMMYELADDNDLKYYEAIQRIIDYITNLQQENERLKKKNDSLGETNLRINGDLKVAKQDRIEYSNELEDYKSRCEKANEFINENTKLEHDGDDYGYMEWINIINMDTMTFINNLSDILNGRSDE